MYEYMLLFMCLLDLGFIFAGWSYLVVTVCRVLSHCFLIVLAVFVFAVVAAALCAVFALCLLVCD